MQCSFPPVVAEHFNITGDKDKFIKHFEDVLAERNFRVPFGLRLFLD